MLVRRAEAMASFAVDFEQFEGLVAPTGGALDGSTGLGAPAAADIVVVCRCAPSGQEIDRLWGGLDTEAVGRAAGGQSAVWRSAAWARCEALMREELGLAAGGELEMEYVGWDTSAMWAAGAEPAAPEPAPEGSETGPL